MLERLRDAREIGYVLEVLDFVYCDKEDSRRLPEELTLGLLRESGVSPKHGDNHDHHWSVVAEQFVAQHSERGSDVFKAALDRVCSEDWYLNTHDASFTVVQKIIRSAPAECWSIVASRLEAAEGPESRELLRSLGPGRSIGSDDISGLLTLFPRDAVLDWIAEDPNERAADIARMAVPKTLARDELGGFARELLNRYGDQDDVRRSLLAHFWSGGGWGSASSHHRRKRDAARKWLESETSMRVRRWIEEYIDVLSRDIKRAEIDEEREF